MTYELRLESESSPELRARVEELLLLRRRAKQERNFKEADSIRDELTDLGVVIRDIPTGVAWKVLPTYVQPRKGITEEWMKLIPLYIHFCPDRESPSYDWSEVAIEEAYAWETRGEGSLAVNVFAIHGGKFNGYAVGKKYMDVSLSMWREDIRQGLLTKAELYEEIPVSFHWWLDRVLSSVTLEKHWKTERK